MKHIRYSLSLTQAAAVLICTCIGGVAYALTEEASIDGQHLKIISAAVSEAGYKIPDVSKYKIHLYRRGDTRIVMFRDPDAPKRLGGGFAKIPTFEVIFDSEGRVLKSYFAQ